MRLRSATIGAIVTVLFASSVFGQKMYTAQYISTPPVIDASDADEWAGVTEEGSWGVLRTDAVTIDAHNNRFQMAWDDDAIYLRNKSDYGGAAAPFDNSMDFNSDNMNVYFDPNLDGEANSDDPTDFFVVNTSPDGYQLALNEYTGSQSCGVDMLPGTADDCSIDSDGDPTNGPIAEGNGGIGTYAEAHFDTPFGNQGNWEGMRGTMISTFADASGITVEMRIPFADLDAVHPDIDGAGTPDTSMDASAGVSNGDLWFFKISQITTDGANFLPDWNPTANNSFAPRTHGEITFDGKGGGGLACDFSGDGQCDIVDLDELYDNFGAGAPYDLNGDEAVNAGDIGAWLDEASKPENPYLAGEKTFKLGDVNLDGNVDSTDLGLLLNKFDSTDGQKFGAGNLNDDVNVDSTDLGLLLNNFDFTSASAGAAAAVPEPNMAPLCLLMVFGLLSRMRRR